MSQYLVPTDAKSTIANLARSCPNLSLILSRYIPKEAIYPKTKGISDPNKMYRAEWLTELINRAVDPEIGRQIKHGAKRWERITESAERIQVRTETRLIVGLGAKGPLEIGITLDYLTGLPIIPGSALKGLCRNYVLLTLAEKCKVPMLEKVDQQGKGDKQNKVTPIDQLETLFSVDPADDKAHQEAYAKFAEIFKHEVKSSPFTREALLSSDLMNDVNLFRLAFGSNEASGIAVFHQATCLGYDENITNRLFDVDVLTPHFPDYYAEKSLPDDGQNPVPVNFLTVARGVQFGVAVGTRRVSNQIDTTAIKQKCMEWLRKGLEEIGIGSKTNSGYGVLSSHSD